MRKIILIAHNLRSCHNVGSLLRTAEGLGVSIYLTGYTPYPKHVGDVRLPHQATKLHRQIQKTALGAESSANWHYRKDVYKIIQKLQNDGFELTALEQMPASIALPSFKPPIKVALLVGRETLGIEPDILKLCKSVLEIPMQGKKESFNVVQAAAMALYHIRYS